MAWVLGGFVEGAAAQTGSLRDASNGQQGRAMSVYACVALTLGCISGMVGLLGSAPAFIGAGVVLVLGGGHRSRACGRQLFADARWNRTEQERPMSAWRRLILLAALCLLAVSAVAMWAAPAKSSPSAYQSYCHSTPERRAWCDWQGWMAEPRNQGWFAVSAHFGDNDRLLADARAIADCESEFYPGAVSPTNDHGVFQIHRPVHERQFERVTGQPWSQVYDAQTNALYARWLWEQSGWQPWTCAR
jgi:hypothetical protein